MVDTKGFHPSDHWITLLDGEGSPLSGMILYDGEVFPGDDGCYERIKRADTFKAREDDVWIVGYPKSGAHWTFDIVKMVIAGSAENVTACKDNHFYEVTPFSEMGALSSPRVIDTHLPLHRIPRDILDKKCRVIYNIRNPKDIAVSYYNHIKSMVFYNYTGSFNGWVKMFLDGKGEYNSWFDNTIPWYEYSKSHPEVLVLKYEDMIKDLTSAVRAVAKHLDRPISEELCQAIARQCSFGVMKTRKKDTERSDWFNNEDGTFYRKGKVGDWKKWFTMAQNEEFDDVFRQRMRDTDLTIEFEV